MPDHAFTTSMSANVAVPTPQELVARAKALAPLLRAQTAEGERQRQVPDMVIGLAREAGLFNVGKPALHGGYEYEPQAMFEVIIELARASSAAGWVIGLLMTHAWEIGLCDPRIAADIWGAEPDALVASSFAPFGTAEPVEGGFVVTGRWPWSSGSDHGQWVVLGVHLPNQESSIGFDHKVMILPRRDYEVDQESWHMAGMQGTGSKDVVVDHVFVPAYRHHDITAAFFHNERLGRETFTAKTYQYPFGIVLAWTLAAAIIGAAEGAIDLYLDKMRKKLDGYTHKPVKDDPFNQQRVAEAAAMVYAARAALRSDFAEMSAAIDADGIVPVPRRAFYKWNAAFHARAAADAISRMVKAAGGGAFALDQELQRVFRDTQTATNHAFLNPDFAARMYGNALLSGRVEDFVL